ncbi:MAG TPA: N-acetylmuramoyl-L-alanine amidase [Chroococcidiopsis sp.]
MISAPADAANLQFWRYSASENRLTFTTDGGVQPRAQLIPNPTRLVIDLPGVTLGSPMVNQQVGGAVREVRLGQFDAQTTRIVIELEAGYTLDPQQVLVRGASPTQWVVQLPEPVYVGTTAQSPPASPPRSPQPGPTSAANGSVAVIDNVGTTLDGFLVRLNGPEPEVEVRRRQNGSQIRVELHNAVLSPQLTQLEREVGRHGVRQVEVEQRDNAVVRITLDLNETNTEWHAQLDPDGIALLPGNGRRVASDRQTRPPGSPRTAQTPTPPSTPNSVPQGAIAVIQSVDLANSGSQLLIQADRPVTYTTTWNRVAGAYQITIPSARLDERVRGPQLGPGSSLQNVRLREESNQTVSILVQPANGVRIGDITPLNNQVLALNLQRAAAQIPVQPPIGTQTPAIPTDLPRVPNSRVVIVVDPGHGGSDPGAVGIGGLRETDIVLPVALQVAQILEQQGVQAVLTRQNETTVELEPRVQTAERANADLFVSIHANSISLSRPDVNGIETYYHSAQGLPLARVLHNSLLQLPGAIDRGVRQANFYVLRNTSMPAVLLELGFVTGAQDARRMSDPNSRSQIATAIARGILQYIQRNL